MIFTLISNPSRSSSDYLIMSKTKGLEVREGIKLSLVHVPHSRYFVTFKAYVALRNDGYIELTNKEYCELHHLICDT